MAEKEIREIQVVTDGEGRTVETSERQTKPVRRGPGFVVGALVGVIILAGAIAIFANSQGSFTNAGADADRASAQAQENIGNAAENAGNALESAGDDAQEAGRAANNNK
jgi:hypothetical protein